MRVGRTGNYIHTMAGIDQRLAQIVEVHTLSTAVGQAAVTEQGNSQRLGVRCGSRKLLFGGRQVDDGRFCASDGDVLCGECSGRAAGRILFEVRSVDRTA